MLIRQEGELASGEARELAFAGGLHAGADDCGGFAGLVILQLANGERGGLDVDVDAVEQRAADARPVFDDL